ncbi:MAG TPA: 1,2-phenylacetyl-CoA epoxidase subunit PaaD [Candidatus Limnocylindrales bacterium]|nr:1,2-phenylacetyl-CoA epoxidase subunit PaaD [Candidatus Limnocylindrales bacterium]
MVTETSLPTEAAVREALATVPDPELPAVSVVDLGVVERVSVGDERIAVELLPTFIGCPALDMIETSVRERLSAFGVPIEVAFTTRVPWTSDRISRAGLRRLAAAGIAPPADPSDVRCPWCMSARVVMDSAFGPTQCRSLFYCRDCRQPFEALKPI